MRFLGTELSQALYFYLILAEEVNGSSQMNGKLFDNMFPYTYSKYLYLFIFYNFFTILLQKI
jgi:hypothetical protein